MVESPTRMMRSFWGEELVWARAARERRRANNMSLGRMAYPLCRNCDSAALCHRMRRLPSYELEPAEGGGPPTLKRTVPSETRVRPTSPGLLSSVIFLADAARVADRPAGVGAIAGRRPVRAGQGGRLLRYSDAVSGADGGGGGAGLVGQ